uniref:Uncharacterized protein n=1 Tax=Cacopsylla melanoneura TaxID=428564 RepID=A0A8D9F6L4_9HEMI
MSCCNKSYCAPSACGSCCSPCGGCSPSSPCSFASPCSPCSVSDICSSPCTPESPCSVPDICDSPCSPCTPESFCSPWANCVGFATANRDACNHKMMAAYWSETKRLAGSAPKSASFPTMPVLPTLGSFPIINNMRRA